MVKAHWIPLTAVSLTTALFWYLVIVTGLVGGCQPGGQSPDIASHRRRQNADAAIMAENKSLRDLLRRARDRIPYLVFEDMTEANKQHNALLDDISQALGEPHPGKLLDCEHSLIKPEPPCEKH